MKRLFFVLTINFILIIGFSGCEGEDTVFTPCDPCDCATQLPSGSSVNCYGQTQSGSGCNNNTLNSCGYCYLHTGQCCY